MIFQQGSSHLAAGALRTNDLHRRQGHGEGRGVLTTTRHLDVSTCEIRNRLVEVGGFPRFFLEKNREKNRGKLDDPQQSSVLSVSCLGAVGSGSSRIPTGNHGWNGWNPLGWPVLNHLKIMSTLDSSTIINPFTRWNDYWRSTGCTPPNLINHGSSGLGIFQKWLVDNGKSYWNGIIPMTFF